MSFEVFVKICLPYHKYYRIPIYFGQKKQPRIGFTDVNVVFYIKAYFWTNFRSKFRPLPLQ